MFNGLNRVDIAAVAYSHAKMHTCSLTPSDVRRCRKNIDDSSSKWNPFCHCRKKITPCRREDGGVDVKTATSSPKKI